MEWFGGLEPYRARLVSEKKNGRDLKWLIFFLTKKKLQKLGSVFLNASEAFGLARRACRSPLGRIVACQRSSSSLQQVVHWWCL